MALTLAVLDHPAAPYLRLLAELPDSTNILVGNRREAFAGTIAGADVMLAGMGTGELLEELLPLARRVKWIHSFSAGVEGVMSPAMVAHPATLTNGRGAFSRSLGEFAIAAILFFAKDFRRMLASQRAGKWNPFDVEEVHGKVLGIVGYGSIGKAAARCARALGMKVLALRRRPEMAAGDPDIEQAFAIEERERMLSQCDYVLVAAPLTPSTRGLIGEREIAAMKPGAVVINVGRGPVISETALLSALEAGRLRGAALDVFDEEPLPPGHPFYRLDNVLLSPHCADHTPGWQDQGMKVFLRNFARFSQGLPLENVVDKTQGY